MDPLTMAAIANAAGGLIQIGTGIAQKAKAKKMARENPRPEYSISEAVLDNQAIAESRASQGLSAGTSQILNQEAQRGLTSSLEASLALGGSANDIGSIYDSFGTNIRQTALMDEQMRQQNMRQLIEQNRMLATEQEKEWTINQYAPWADRAQAAAATSAQASDNTWKGATTLLSATNNYATGTMYQREMAGVFGNRQPMEVAPQPTTSNGYFDPAATWGSSNNQYTPPIPMTPEQQAAAAVRSRYPGLTTAGIFVQPAGFDPATFNR